MLWLNILCKAAASFLAYFLPTCMAPLANEDKILIKTSRLEHGWTVQE